MRNDLPTRLQHVGGLASVFSLTFSSYFTSCFFSPAPYSRLWNLSILLSQSVSHPRISPSPGWLKKNLHTLKFTFCGVKLFGFWQMHKSYLPPQFHTEESYHPKITLWVPFVVPSFFSTQFYLAWNLLMLLDWCLTPPIKDGFDPFSSVNAILCILTSQSHNTHCNSDIIFTKVPTVLCYYFYYRISIFNFYKEIIILVFCLLHAIVSSLGPETLLYSLWFRKSLFTVCAH